MTRNADQAAPSKKPHCDLFHVDEINPLKVNANLRKEPPVYESDPIFYRRVALTLGIVVVLSLGGLIMLAIFGKDVPQGIFLLAAVALRALAGVFKVGRKRK